MNSSSSSVARLVLLLSRAAARASTGEGCRGDSSSRGSFRRFLLQRRFAGSMTATTAATETTAATATTATKATSATTATTATTAAAAPGNPTGLGPLPERRPARPHVVVALSGGVDSAVAALLLRDSRSCEVACVHAAVWSGADEERGGSGEGEELLSSASSSDASSSSSSSSSSPSPSCSAAADAESAAAVARCLGLEMLRTEDAVSRYWLDVFEPFAAGYARGLTPNPDLGCNVSVKFGALLDAAEAAGADVLATGHYARLRWRRSLGSRGGIGGGGGGKRRFPASAAAARALGWEFGGGGGGGDVESDPSYSPSSSSADQYPQLLRAADRARDQTYFLASVGGAALARCAFPLGSLTKEQVRAIARGEASSSPAAAAGGVFSTSSHAPRAPLAPLLAASERRSSAGICFVGRRRSFGGFMAQYVEPLPGEFVGVEEAWRWMKKSRGRNGASSSSSSSGGGDDDTSPSSSFSSSAAADPPLPPPPPPIAPCRDLLALTHGQRARIGGRSEGAAGPLYVAAKDLKNRRVLVAEGRHHRALFCRDALLDPREEAWVAGEPPRGLLRGGEAGSGGVRLEYKARYRQPPRPLTVERAPTTPADADADDSGGDSRPYPHPPPSFFEPSRLFSLLPPSRLLPSPPPHRPPHLPPLVARFDLPARAVTPGQALVLYSGEVCLGSAGGVLMPGRSLLELGEVEVEGAAVAAAEGEAVAGWG